MLYIFTSKTLILTAGERASDRDNENFCSLRQKLEPSVCDDEIAFNALCVYIGCTPNLGSWLGFNCFCIKFHGGWITSARRETMMLDEIINIFTVE